MDSGSLTIVLPALTLRLAGLMIGAWPTARYAGMSDVPPSRLDYNGLAGPYAAYRREDEAVVEALRAGADVRSAARVLEVGCGTGDYVAALRAASGCTASGVDPSAKMVAIARRRHGGISFERGSAERLPFSDAGFDFVFSVDVVHHLPDLDAACTQALRVLVTGGRACIVTEDEDAIRGRLHSRYFPASIPVELARYPTLEKIRGSLAQAGFVDISCSRRASSYVVDDLRPYAEKAFSSLHLIGDEAHRAGRERLERDLKRGPVAAVSRAVLVWATRPRE